MRTLVLGGTGMLGHRLAPMLSEKMDVLATIRRETEHSRHALAGLAVRSGVEASDLSSVERVLGEFRPDAVVNCIGVVKQAPQAASPTTCIAINALFPHELHQLCQKYESRLLHISTDCVFSGKIGRYTENHLPDPDDLYGRTKLLGEIATEGALTIRTSMIGRELGASFGLVEWFLGQPDPVVKGFRNAIFSGFTTSALSNIVRKLLLDFGELSGVWHVSSAPISKLDLLIMLRAAFRLDVEVAPDDELSCDRSLASDRFWRLVDEDPPSWNKMIKELAAESGPYQPPRRARAN